MTRDEQEILHGVSLTVRPGELVAIIGQAGRDQVILAGFLLLFLPCTQAVLTARTGPRSRR